RARAVQYLVQGHDQMGLAALVLHDTVPDMAYGGKGKDGLEPRVYPGYQGQDPFQALGDLPNGKEAFGEFPLGHFMAVRYGLATGTMVIYPGRPQGEDQMAGPFQGRFGFRQLLVEQRQQGLPLQGTDLGMCVETIPDPLAFEDFTAVVFLA